MAFGLRSAVRWAASGKSFETWVSAMERLGDKQPLLRVLMYHRVDELAARADLAPCALSATPDNFNRQMQFLAENYSVISLEEMLESRQQGSPLPPRAVMITFDDAYRDFEENAWPILKRHDLPATLFVPTAYPDHPQNRFWWDRVYHAIMQAAPATYPLEPWGSLSLGTLGQRESAVRRLSDHIESLEHAAACDLVDQVCDILQAPIVPGAVLGWEQLRALAGPKLALAPHTRTHPLLSRTTTAQAREEVLGALEDLQREIGATPRVLAYPGGALTSDVVAMLRAEGFELAFTTRRGIVDCDRSDPLRLNRINVGYRCPFGLWRGQLLAVTRHLSRN